MNQMAWRTPPTGHIWPMADSSTVPASLAEVVYGTKIGTRLVPAMPAQMDRMLRMGGWLIVICEQPETRTSRSGKPVEYWHEMTFFDMVSTL